MTRVVRRRTGSMTVWVYLASVVILSAVALACALLLASKSPEAIGELRRQPSALTGHVIATGVDYGQGATLEGSFSPGPSLLATGLIGTITGANIAPGVRLTTGVELYRVDDRPVVAYVGDQVFFRPLSIGAQGPDVLAAQQLLNAVVEGAQIEEDGRFGASSLHAVRDYARTAGFGRQVTQFEPSWFVRVPYEQYEIQTSAVTVGAAAPGPGEPIITTSPQLTSASVAATAEGRDGQYVFVFEAKQVPVERINGEWQIADLASALQVLTPEADSSTAAVEGYLRLAEPVPAQSIPAASIVPGAAGDTYCVLLETSDGYSPTQVHLAGVPAPDQVFIEPTLADGSMVLVNPREIAPATACP